MKVGFSWKIFQIWIVYCTVRSLFHNLVLPKRQPWNEKKRRVFSKPCSVLVVVLSLLRMYSCVLWCLEQRVHFYSYDVGKHITKIKSNKTKLLSSKLYIYMARTYKWNFIWKKKIFITTCNKRERSLSTKEKTERSFEHKIHNLIAQLLLFFIYLSSTPGRERKKQKHVCTTQPQLWLALDGAGSQQSKNRSTARRVRAYNLVVSAITY